MLNKGVIQSGKLNFVNNQTALPEIKTTAANAMITVGTNENLFFMENCLIASILFYKNLPNYELYSIIRLATLYCLGFGKRLPGDTQPYGKDQRLSA